MQRYPTRPLPAGEYEDFIPALLRVFEEKVFNAREFDAFPVHIIVDYIQHTHVYYLSKKLPEIEQSILPVVQVNTNRTTRSSSPCRTSSITLARPSLNTSARERPGSCPISSPSPPGRQSNARRILPLAPVP